MTMEPGTAESPERFRSAVIYVVRENVYGWGVYNVEQARWARFRLTRLRATQLARQLNEHARQRRERLRREASDATLTACRKKS